MRGAARRARFPLRTERVREAASMVGVRNEALPGVGEFIYEIAG